MFHHSTMTVANGSSIDGNSAANYVEPTSTYGPGLVIGSHGGGAEVSYYSTLSVTDGSSINGNTAALVSSPAFAFASGLAVVSPGNQSTLDRCGRENSRRSSTKEALRSPARPLAVGRRRLRV